MKITACLGFMILGIIIDCGGVPTDNRGYIGARFWYEHVDEIFLTLTNPLVSGTLQTALSLMASMDSVPSLSRPHLPLAEPNLLDSLLPRPKTQRKKFPKPPGKSSGVFAYSTLSICSSSASLYPQTARFTKLRDPPVVVHPL
jgi:hypothetical protein